MAYLYCHICKDTYGIGLQLTEVSAKVKVKVKVKLKFRRAQFSTVAWRHSGEGGEVIILRIIISALSKDSGQLHASTACPSR